MRTAFIILTPTILTGNVIACWESSKEDPIEKPCIYETKEAAWKEIADDRVTILTQFIEGERSLEDTDFDTEDYVEEVNIASDGVITNMFGYTLYDPKIGRL